MRTLLTIKNEIFVTESMLEKVRRNEMSKQGVRRKKKVWNLSYDTSSVAD